MTPETRAALEGSIKKWQRIVAGEDICQGSRNCPLCTLFNPWETPREERNWPADRELCDGCPVKDKTGLTGCLGSPWLPYEELKPNINTPKALAIAREELAFLESPRPQDDDA